MTTRTPQSSRVKTAKGNLGYLSLVSFVSTWCLLVQGADVHPLVLLNLLQLVVVEYHAPLRTALVPVVARRVVMPPARNPGRLVLKPPPTTTSSRRRRCESSDTQPQQQREVFRKQTGTVSTSRQKAPAKRGDRIEVIQLHRRRRTCTSRRMRGASLQQADESRSQKFRGAMQDTGKTI